MIVDTYAAWAVRKTDERNKFPLLGFVRNSSNEIHLTDKQKAENLAKVPGYEAVEVLIQISTKE